MRKSEVEFKLRIPSPGLLILDDFVGFSGAAAAFPELSAIFTGHWGQISDDHENE